jgi:hypothetical protein
MLNRKGSDADALTRVGFASGFAVPAESLRELRRGRALWKA